MSTDNTSQNDDRFLVVTRSVEIPRDEFRFATSTSSGPGGQHVNKTSTKVQLRWNVSNTSSLRDDVRERFLKKYSRQINQEGELLITSQRYRSQLRNRDDCLEKLSEWIRSVLTPPKKRKPTRPSRASKERRLKEKKKQSQRKESRRRPNED